MCRRAFYKDDLKIWPVFLLMILNLSPVFAYVTETHENLTELKITYDRDLVDRCVKNLTQNSDNSFYECRVFKMSSLVKRLHGQFFYGHEGENLMVVWKESMPICEIKGVDFRFSVGSGRKDDQVIGLHVSGVSKAYYFQEDYDPRAFKLLDAKKCLRESLRIDNLRAGRGGSYYIYY